MTRTCEARLGLVVLLATGLLFAGCSRNKPGETAEPDAASSVAAVRTPAAAAAPASVQSATTAPASGTLHDPAHPPIDCPLRKQGIDPGHLRPFGDIAKYIEFLERPDRAAWQKPDAVVAALDLGGDEVVLDVGAGSGYFSFRFAKAVRQGKVIAGDTEPEMVRHLHHRAMTEGIANVEARIIEPGDPGVDTSVDLVFVCDVLHHVAAQQEWLSKIARGMKTGSRLALIEFKEGSLPQGPPEGAKIPRRELVALGERVGLQLAEDHEGLLPYQVFLVFRKP